jgi:large subunit ribosomal protein L17
MHRHSYRGRKLQRDKGQRKALLRSLATSVVLYEKVKTTMPKAKEIRPYVEKLITLAKKGDLAATRELNNRLLSTKAVEKLIKEIAPLYKERQGGYTRITAAGFRAGDNAKMAIIELLDVEKLNKKEAPKAKEAKPEKSEEKPAVKKPAAKATAKKAPAKAAAKGSK